MSLAALNDADLVAAIGIVASGGIAVGWHAAIGGVAAAREFALGGATVAQHMNDSAAREFFAHHHWMDITQSGPRNAFWIVSFAPLFMQVLVLNWWWRRSGQAHRVVGPPSNQIDLNDAGPLIPPT